MGLGNGEGAGQCQCVHWTPLVKGMDAFVQCQRFDWVGAHLIMIMIIKEKPNFFIFQSLFFSLAFVSMCLFPVLISPAGGFVFTFVPPPSPIPQFHHFPPMCVNSKNHGNLRRKFVVCPTFWLACVKWPRFCAYIPARTRKWKKAGNQWRCARISPMSWRATKKTMTSSGATKKGMRLEGTHRRTARGVGGIGFCVLRAHSADKFGLGKDFRMQFKSIASMAQ